MPFAYKCTLFVTAGKIDGYKVGFHKKEDKISCAKTMLDIILQEDKVKDFTEAELAAIEQGELKNIYINLPHEIKEKIDSHINSSIARLKNKEEYYSKQSDISYNTFRINDFGCQMVY
ncbi:MAG: hypothetical protein GY821_16520 [Gammaproteobacteria bacterium]|nr:hypothetical protein [Gammaproteobacteria bacterium]